MGVAGLGGEPVGGALDGDGVQAEALGRGVPRLAALEELEDLGARRRGAGRPRARGPRRRRRCSRPGRGACPRPGWPAAGRRSRARRRTRSPRRRRPSTAAPRRRGASTRLRDSARAGKSSSASKAAVRRLPWPSLRGGRRRACGSPEAGRGRDGQAVGGGRAASWASSVTEGGSGGRGPARSAALLRLSARVDERLSPTLVARQPCGVASRARRRSGRSVSLAAEQRHGLEDPGRDRRAGERDAQRLEDLLGLDARTLDDAARAPPRRASGVQGSGSSASAVARRARAPRAAAPAPRNFSRAVGVVGRPVEEEARQRPELVERRDLLLGDRDRVAQAACGR